MGNFEVAKAMAPYGHVMVASEELEPGNGWDYTPMLEALNNLRRWMVSGLVM
jgi:hypothetical protein